CNGSTEYFCAKRRKIQPRNNKKLTEEELRRILEDSDCTDVEGSEAKVLTILATMIRLLKMKIIKMVRNYAKKRPNPSWTEEDMTKALEIIHRNEISVGKASEQTELVEQILDCERRFYGITPLDARGFAFELAEHLQLDHPFNKTAKLAGNDWLSGFKKINPQLSIRAPEPNSIARAAGFNKPKFRILKANNIQPDKIYNIDETGINSVPVPRKILAEKGKKTSRADSEH
ncbi:hypothetical protein NQ318_006913, partial [Aromia moschata]